MRPINHSGLFVPVLARAAVDGLVPPEPDPDPPEPEPEPLVVEAPGPAHDAVGNDPGLPVPPVTLEDPICSSVASSTSTSSAALSAVLAVHGPPEAVVTAMLVAADATSAEVVANAWFDPWVTTTAHFAAMDADTPGLAMFSGPLPPSAMAAPSEPTLLGATGEHVRGR